MKKQLKPGSVFEIPTARGYAFVQVTHLHPREGVVVWVMPMLLQDRPDDLSGLLADEGGFFAFCPLAALLEQGRAIEVGRLEIPGARRAFPLFRDFLGTDPEGH